MLNSAFMVSNIKKEKLKVAKYYFKKYAIKQQDATKPAVIANKINSVIISTYYKFINAKTMQN